MRYRQPIGERISYFFEKIWWCEIKRRHHVKMDSHGRCYRCNRLIEPIQ